MRGVHRPPVNFGIGPFFPSFDEKQPHSHQQASDVAGGGGRKNIFGGEQHLRTESFASLLKTRLRECCSQGKFKHIRGVKHLSLHGISGEMEITKKFRGGSMQSYANFELEITLSCSVDVGSSSHCLLYLRVPYFGEDSEIGDIELNALFPTKKAELVLSKKIDIRNVRTKVRTIVAPLLLEVVNTIVAKENA